ncbi:MAG: dihydrofolate reductase [Desulfobacula sp.]|jgi:dihydrofolate reductase|uniref:dihydrofolate reductase family protein n=1 Tax=Desulfobacula sp. TaxID=2593537 RepID=UPI001DE59B92|nr:dihydrofolate reductase [Desulfobacula sp.]MBT3484217.1 dihydrofolate reductase [Desulfobacula sp.]MBT3804309.1 dihydrofolate reductase [Desulfobacula sp.]MBT4026253.1 dihydrofolate reductase [Desulfobacula sp.]MBT4198143.1 dihydrofolate reductase [Desulfobacula sp.]
MKVILLMAVTADGMIARNSMELIDWTGKGDKKYFVRVTRKAGVMIMGSKTFDTIGKVLPGRKNIVMTRDKTRISRDENLLFTSQTPEEILNDLQTKGFKSAALIGGSIVNTLFMKQNLVDEIHVTIVPRIFGRGLSLFHESLDKLLELIDMEKIDQGYVLLKYRVK